MKGRIRPRGRNSHQLSAKTDSIPEKADRSQIGLGKKADSILLLSVKYFVSTIQMTAYFHEETFLSLSYWVLTIIQHEPNMSQHEPTRANTSQHEPNTSQHEPTRVKNEPTRANTSQHEPTRANTSQHDPTWAKHEPTRANTSQHRRARWRHSESSDGYIAMVGYCQRYFDFENIDQFELWHKILLLCIDKIEWYIISLCTPCLNATLI